MARCHPRHVVDAHGGFRASLTGGGAAGGPPLTAAVWAAALTAPAPPFDLLAVSDLLPPEVREAYEEVSE